MKVVFNRLRESTYIPLLERTYTVGDTQYWKRGGKYFSWSDAGGRKEISQDEYFKALSGGDDTPQPTVKKELPKIDKKDYAKASDEDLATLASSGDERATDVIIRRYEPLVHKLSNKYFLKGGDRDDLVQNGLIGMWDAIKTYDVNKNDNFGKYIAHAVDNRLKSAVRSDDTQKNQFINTATSMDANAPGKEGSEDGRSYGDTIASKELSPEEKYMGKDGAEKLMNFMKNELAPKERDVIFRFINGSSISEIAEDLGVSYKSVENAIGRVRYKIKDFKSKNESKHVRESKRVTFKLK